MNSIFRIKLGFANVWLLKGKNGFLIFDAGIPGYHKSLFKKLEALNVRPEQVSLAVASHVHFDHVGAMAAIKKTCGCPVIVHKKGANLLRMGEWRIPEGTGFLTRTAVSFGKKYADLLARKTRYEAVEPDIEIESSISLNEFGFDARIIPTPGHTEDSISVITDGGDAFVGDLAYNELPFLAKHRRPPFINDPGLLKASWRLLAKNGAKIIHPGHGAAFSAEQLLAKK